MNIAGSTSIDSMHAQLLTRSIEVVSEGSIVEGDIKLGRAQKKFSKVLGDWKEIGN